MDHLPFGGRRSALLISLVVVLCTSCSSSENRAIEILASSIDRHGGALFDDSYIRFEFRGTPFEVLRDEGRFRYQRTVTDSAGGPVTEVMENSGTWLERDGVRSELDSAGIYRVETDVNSVVYFGFLPFRLDDPAVVAEYLGEATVDGEPYHEIEVSFRREDGGSDWDTRFVHWIHQDELTVDYMAYRYTRDGGGTRFRRAVNRREIGGLLIQDYENYGAEEDIDALAEYDTLYEEGELELLSMIELENVRVERAEAFEASGTGADAADNGLPDRDATPVSPELEGVEVSVAMESATYGPSDSVRVSIQVVNRSSATRTLQFPSAMRYDLVVRSASGEELIRWSEGRAFAQTLGEIPLEPGASVEYAEAVPAPGVPGSYRLTAVVPVQPEALEVSVPLEVRE